MVDLKALVFRQDLKIFVMFLITQFLGLWLAAQVYSGAVLVQQTSAQASQSLSYVLGYMIAIIAFAALLVVIVTRVKSRVPFLLLEAVAVGGASAVFFLIAFGGLTGSLSQSLYGNAVTYVDIAAIVAAGLLILAKNKWPRLRNATSIIASAGIGLLIGINFNFGFAYLFMVILAVYDFIAVFITKHMVTMGRAMYDMNLSFLIGTTEAEAVPKRGLDKETIKVMPKHRAAFERQGQLLKELDRRGMAPIVMRRGLGNGDLAVPLVMAVSAYRLFWNFTLPLVIVLGASFGLVLTFVVLSKLKRDLPAIPPLLFGITVALVIYFLAVGVSPF